MPHPAMAVDVEEGPGEDPLDLELRDVERDEERQKKEEKVKEYRRRRRYERDEEVQRGKAHLEYLGEEKKKVDLALQVEEAAGGLEDVDDALTTRQLYGPVETVRRENRRAEERLKAAEDLKREEERAEELRERALGGGEMERALDARERRLKEGEKRADDRRKLAERESSLSRREDLLERREAAEDDDHERREDEREERWLAAEEEDGGDLAERVARRRAASDGETHRRYLSRIGLERPDPLELDEGRGDWRKTEEGGWVPLDSGLDSLGRGKVAAEERRRMLRRAQDLAESDEVHRRKRRAVNREIGRVGRLRGVEGSTGLEGRKLDPRAGWKPRPIAHDPDEPAEGRFQPRPAHARVSGKARVPENPRRREGALPFGETYRDWRRGGATFDLKRRTPPEPARPFSLENALAYALVARLAAPAGSVTGPPAVPHRFRNALLN